MVATRMMAASARNIHATRTRAPSRLRGEARGRPCGPTHTSAQPVMASAASTKTERGVPTPPSPKAWTDWMTPLRVR